MKSSLIKCSMGREFGEFVEFSLASLWGLACVKRQYLFIYLFILRLLFPQLADQWHFLLSLRPVGWEKGKEHKDYKICILCDPKDKEVSGTSVTGQNLTATVNKHNNLPSFSFSSVSYGLRSSVVKSGEEKKSFSAKWLRYLIQPVSLWWMGSI